MSEIFLLGQNFLALFIESAPWLLLGLLVAGVMHEIVPVSFLEKHMGNESFSSISKAAIIGAPLPLCSCGVIPAALGLRRSGASKPSTISFLVSTPETGVDSVSVSYALLGPLYAIIRPITAVLSAIYAGVMVRLFDSEVKGVPASLSTESSCCASQTKAPAPPTSCCASDKGHQHQVAPTPSVLTKLSRVVSFASGKLLEDIVVWLLIGLGLAAAIKTWVPTDFLTQWGDGLLAMVVMAVIGIPMYICATASTPLAVGFLAAGLSPGAVLVFLMAGPATNVSTMGMIKQEMGSRTLMLYLFSVMSASIGFGYGLNYMVNAFSLSHLINTQSHLHEHGRNVQALYAVCAIVLAALMARLGWKKWRQAREQKHAQSACCG
ncbi:hypothetical protein KUL152_29910 [Tenacibaculum sp. KUL152]|nr:hypothetical protein KUL152_29910 [Tenacibaculum sp. KUL152]